jgi:ATP-dependent helicase/nuclease subunit B
VSVSDAEEEVRTAVERIVAAARAGTPLEAMAVLYPADRPYARLAAAQLDAAGIPWNGRAVRPLSDRVLGRWLLDLLALPEQRVARPAVLGLLGGAPMRTADGRPIPLAAWERASREAGIVRDRSEWRAKLPRLARDLRARADAAAAEEEPREWVVHRSRAGADATEGLAAFVDELFGALDEAAAVGTWSGLAAWCAGAVRRFLGGEASRATWPEDERRAADRVEEALDRLAGLDEVEGATTLPVFRRTLELELDDDLGRTGALGRGVLVGTPSQALGVDLALVVVLGLAEGVLPTRPREDSLLPDSDRAVVGDVLQPRSARTGVEHRHLLAALAAASGERVLVFPRGDLRRSVERTPSRWLLDAVEALGADARELPDTAPWLEVVPSFAARVRAAAFPATRQEYGLRALADVGPADLPDHPLVVADTVLARGAELARNRGVAGFTRFDGNLSDLAGSISSPAEDGRPTSTSRIEAWLSCPHAYLVRHVLGVEPVENPEELLEMTALDRGTLVHEVLERWLRGELALEVPHSGTPWSPAARDRLRAIAAEVLDAAEARGLTGHPLLWRRDRRLLGIDLERFVDADDERRRRDGLTPIGAEQPFGLPDSGTDPVEIDLGDGRSVRIRGQIDRLDRAADGTLVVADYKTGGTSSYAGLGPDQPLGGDGTKLQLAVYALAMRAAQDADAVRSEYWFTSAKGEFKRLGYVLDDAVESALRRALRVAVDGIAAGHFPMKPPEPAFRVFTVCAYCDPDDLGTADRFRDWERIRTDDALRGYVGYIDPDALDEQEDR